MAPISYCYPSGSRLLLKWPRANTTIAPETSSSLIAAKFARRRSACSSGVRESDDRINRNEGALIRRKARRAPKSVSCEIMTRLSSRARSKMSSSEASASPRSRTAMASCPAARSRSANRGDMLASTRNLTQGERAATHALGRQRRHTPEQRGCRRVPGQESLPESPRPNVSPQAVRGL